MRRNAFLTGIITLLLGAVAVFWAAPSVANEKTIATDAHTAAVPRTRVAAVLPVVPVPVVPSPAVTPEREEPVAPVILPVVNHSTITDHHQLLASRTLAALPAGCRDHLKNFSVLYKGATRRGLGGKTTIILDGSVPDDEFVALLTHECGHVIGGNLLGSATSGVSMFRDGKEIYFRDSPMVAYWQLSWATEESRAAGSTNTEFASGYGKSDAFEDFAEFFAAYVLQRDMLEDRAASNDVIAAKLAWMEEYLPMDEESLGIGTATWTGSIPWDVTKLPLELTVD